MGQYYFIAASMPSLSFDQAPGTTTGDFLDVCQRHMSPGDWDAVRLAVLEPNRGDLPVPGPGGAFETWERSLRNDLVKLRAPGRGKDPKEDLREGESLFETQVLAQEAFRQESPLDAELILSRGRFDFLEDQKTGHFFDLTYLVCYYLQLQILERKALFDPQKGYEKYEEIYHNILDSAAQDPMIGERE